MRNFAKITSALLITSSLAACSAMDRIENIGEAPRLAAVGNPAGQQIVAAIPAPAPIRHIDNSLWQPGAKSFFNDPRASRIGAVITVNVSTAHPAHLPHTTSRSPPPTPHPSMDNP